MNFRERYVLIGVGALVAVGLGYGALVMVSGAFTSRSERIALLEKDLKDAKNHVKAGEKAKKTLHDAEVRSLPPDPEIGQREYLNWLGGEVNKVGMAEPKVDYKSQQEVTDASKPLFTRKEFVVTGKATLPQLVEFLHSFYSQDWLHRVTRLTIRPIKDSKLFDVSLNVDAVMLKSAKPSDVLKPLPGKRLQLANGKAYYDTIVGRNLFGPPNNPPRVSVSGIKDIYLGRSADLTVKGSDTDPLDKVTYRLVEAADKSATLDPATGRFSWKPPDIGKYEFAFEAIDDGYPAMPSKVEKIVLNVTPQPQRPDEGPPPPPRLGFDKSKFTILTGVVSFEGQSEIWLHNRPDGETLRLHQGDQFEIGSIKGTIAVIGERDFTFDREGKRLKVARGESLYSAKVIGDTPVAAPAEAPQPTVETSTTVPVEAPLPKAPAPAKPEKAVDDAPPAPAPVPPAANGESGKTE